MTSPTRKRLLERIQRIFVRAVRALPAAIEREHLRWALREIDPLHPDVGFILHRLRELESA